MDYLIGFILGLLACGFLWALRELERRQVFEAAAEEIEALRASNQRCKEMCAYLRNGIHGIRIDLGEKGSLPALAEQSGQQLAVRVTTQLPSLANFTGSPANGGPVFSGRQQ